MGSHKSRFHYLGGGGLREDIENGLTKEKKVAFS